jgi:hypothetical protein
VTDPSQLTPPTIIWSEDASRLSIELCNMVNLQPGPDGVVVTLGHTSPKLPRGQETDGPPAELDAYPIARVVMSANVAEEFAELLTISVDQVRRIAVLMDQAKQAERDGAP